MKSNPEQLFGCGAEVGKHKIFFVWSEKLLKSEEVLQDMLADQVGLTGIKCFRGASSKIECTASVCVHAFLVEAKPNSRGPGCPELISRKTNLAASLRSKADHLSAKRSSEGDEMSAMCSQPEYQLLWSLIPK